MNAWWRAVGAVLRKDLLLEWRSREALTAMAFFALLVTVLFGFSFDAGRIDRDIMAETLGPGLLWIAFSFSGVLGLNRSFALEREGGCLQALMLAPVDRSAVFAGKMLGNLLLIGLVEVLTVPVFSILMRVSVLPCLPRLALVAFLGTLGFSAVGTLLSALASGSRLREVLLPLLLYPVWVPVLIAATQLTGQALGGRPAAEGGQWLALIAAYDLIFITAGLLLFDRLLEE